MFFKPQVSGGTYQKLAYHFGHAIFLLTLSSDIFVPQQTQPDEGTNRDRTSLLIVRYTVNCPTKVSLRVLFGFVSDASQRSP